MRTLSLSAPAKINLFLHILGRRVDGYHELQTAFQFLDIADTIHLSLRDDDNITLSPDLPGVPTKDNLIYRAAKALQGNKKCGADIRLDKRLPCGGGLGGGSSDAATTLVGLNLLWELNLDLKQLQHIGLTLGADVPVFIHGQTCWASGIGEQFSPLHHPEPWYLVVIPPCEVSTQQIFSDSQLTRDTKRITIRTELPSMVHNDCLPVVLERYPAVAQAYEWLDGIAQAQLTGTGACLFAAFDSETEAQACFTKKPSNLTAYVTQGKNLSPLYCHSVTRKWYNCYNAQT